LVLLLAIAFFAGYLVGKPTQAPQNVTTPVIKTKASFSHVVSQHTPHQVIPFNPKNTEDLFLQKELSRIADEITFEFSKNGSPIHGLKRINEASRFVEDALLKKLNTVSDLECSIPLNSKGKTQRSGYPDLHILHKPSDKHYYLDPKLFSQNSATSSLRTFYYSPTSQNKIHHDATHLLLGISHDGNNGNWAFLNWKLVDLYNLPVQLKSEYNASNKEIYSENLILIQSSH